MKIDPYEETHMEGTIEISSLFLETTRWNSHKHIPPFTDLITAKGDFGIQISEDGRIWICINGVSFVRFNPNHKYKTKGSKLMGGNE